jgi:hypothetical protein
LEELRQSPIIARILSLGLKYNGQFTTDGSGHFLLSLESELNDKYVCYVCTGEPKPMDESIADYRYVAKKTWDLSFPETIVMFVTITTSSAAKIAMHMGVSSGGEWLIYGHRGLSPAKGYQDTTPVGGIPSKRAGRRHAKYIS